MFVVADPVAQVKAPELANHLFARAGVDAIVVPLQVRADQLPGFVQQGLAARNVRGLFVSIPHKTPLVPLLDRLDPVAHAAGAVNAVRRGADGALEGALFDGAGFVGALAHHGVQLQGKRALLVGAGGAGLALAAALAQTPLAELQVHDRDPARAATLAERAGALSPHPVRVAAAGSDARGFGLVIQATPLGLCAADALPLDPSRIEHGAVLVDILMTAEPTPLVRAARERGIHAHMGHEMLLQQLPEYMNFFGFADLAQALRSDKAHWLGELRQTLKA